jgi:hypothetical protein
MTSLGQLPLPATAKPNSKKTRGIVTKNIGATDFDIKKAEQNYFRSAFNLMNYLRKKLVPTR